MKASYYALEICMSEYIIRKMKDHEQTKESVIAAAAKLIKEDIRQMQFPCDSYPSHIDICKSNGEIDENEEDCEWIPKSLQLFMTHLICNKLKRSSLSQCIVQASRSRSVIAAPICLVLE